MNELEDRGTNGVSGPIEPPRRIYTPSELNQEVRLHIEAAFSRIWLEAEVSNLARPASGHLYFTLKDDKAQIRCALFRSAAARLGVQPQNGMKVLAAGRLSLYEARGDYQMIVETLQHAGEGLLQIRFEQLKNKLAGEGLFDADRKRALPAYPWRIALITSPSGAAIRDMLHVLGRRWPLARVRLYPVPVQGEEAPPAIVRALAAVQEHGWAELILLGRGGGSLEDLWAFNDEAVARGIAACAVPVVSAVGHETDFSIADFVADLRAPTPSAAAELATPDTRVLKASLERLMRQLAQRMADRRNAAGQRLDHLAHRLEQRHPQRGLAEQRQRLRLAGASLRREMARRLATQAAALAHVERQLLILQPGKRVARAGERLAAAWRAVQGELRSLLARRRDHVAELARTLHAVSPLETIGRGYAVLTATASHSLIARSGDVPGDGRITAQLADGRLFCSVEGRDSQTLGDGDESGG